MGTKKNLMRFKEIITDKETGLYFQIGILAEVNILYISDFSTLFSIKLDFGTVLGFIFQRWISFSV